MRRPTLTRIAGALAGAALLAAGWLYLAPVQLGGSTSYAVVVGSSMEPLLHRGDLALIRTNDGYGVGDVVLYDNVELGKVLHRIVRADGAAFVLKGDNNSFEDDVQPTRAQVVGRMWVSVPKVGVVTDWVREPRHAAIVVALATLLALGGGGGAAAVSRRRRRPAAAAAAVVPVPAAARSSGALPLQSALVPLLVAAAAFGALALAAWTRPLERTESLDAAYVQQGRFDYSADVRRSVVYPDGRVDTGEPVFRRLVDGIRVRFAYEVTSALPLAVTGTIRLDATVSDGRGWSRTIPLATERPFTGVKATAEGLLDLRSLGKLTDRVQELTGSAAPTYAVTIAPLVVVKGALGGRDGRDTFGPTLPFDLDPLRLQVGSGAAGGEGVSPFAPRVDGVGIRTVANDLELGAVALAVPQARLISLAGLAAALLLLALAGATALARRRGSEPERIAARYGDLLLAVSSPPQPDRSRVTELADFETLARLAERYDRMVLHAEDEGEHSYLVEDAGAWYRYRCGARMTIELPPPEPGRPGANLAPGALIPGGNGRRFESRRSRLARIARGRSPR